jgi:hypothetical protein
LAVGKETGLFQQPQAIALKTPQDTTSENGDVMSIAPEANNPAIKSNRHDS